MLGSASFCPALGEGEPTPGQGWVMALGSSHPSSSSLQAPCSTWPPKSSTRGHGATGSQQISGPWAAPSSRWPRASPPSTSWAAPRLPCSRYPWGWAGDGGGFPSPEIAPLRGGWSLCSPRGCLPSRWACSRCTRRCPSPCRIKPRRSSCAASTPTRPSGRRPPRCCRTPSSPTPGGLGAGPCPRRGVSLGGAGLAGGDAGMSF